MRLGAVSVFVCLWCSAFAGELRGTIQRGSAPTPSPKIAEALTTPPTAWEIPLPLVPVSAEAPTKPSNKGEPTDALLVLIPKEPGKRPKPPQIVLNGAKTKPNPAFITMQDTVTFLSKQDLTLLFIEDKALTVPKKKKVTKGFSKEGVYRFTAQEDASLQGLIIVGTGARTQEVSESFRVKGLQDGSWSVYLATPSDIIYAGEVTIGDKEETIEINLP
jgi:hypothetical protein